MTIALAAGLAIGLALACASFAGPPATSPPDASAPLPEDPNTDIGYPSVDAALAGLHAKPGVVFSTRDGWTVADDKATLTLWSFPPPGHPAYPSAVMRQLVQMGGGWGVTMKVMCGATKAACDDLVRSFEALNEKMRADLQSRRP